jgi:glyoxylase-like metal-dependent hydrolase (beta-lactamase superfamily II)
MSSPHPVAPAPIREGLTAIDLGFQGQPEVIAAYLLRDSGENALVEIGPTSSFDTLIAGLQRSGVDPATISKVLVTHIHLDHAGASGTFLRHFPAARLFVHEFGVRHMIDPSRLVASATRIYGDMMDTLWGPIEPAPADRITGLSDGDTVTIGSTRLRAIYTPGHASHHVVYHDPARDEVFTGDVAAVRLWGHQYVRPPTPPPDIDLAKWTHSIGLVRSLHPQALYLTHYGRVTDVDWHLEQTHDRLYAWAEVVRRALEAGQDREQIIAELRAHGDAEIARDVPDPSALERYELATPYYMSVDGLLRYLGNPSPPPPPSG